MRTSAKGLRAACLFACAAVLSLGSARAADAPAGTVVSNTASLSFDIGGTGQSISSNTVSIILAERLDVTVTAEVPAMAADPAATETAVGFRVSNTGNGSEDFAIVAAAAGATAATIAVDTDDNGVYDADVDAELPANTLALGPGQAKRLFVIVRGVQQAAQVSLTATSETGSGAQGLVFAGKGEGGGDAVVGATGASAIASTQLTLTSALQKASLVKSQTVLAPDGSTRAVKGAVITYTLEARFAAAIDAVEIVDPIPAGTVYVAGSMRLDQDPLSDTADSDRGTFDGGSVKIALGDIAAPGTRTIRFQVIIQ